MIQAFNFESKQHNDNSLMGGIKIFPVNQNNVMMKFWPKQRKKITIILFIWYDICNNIYVNSQFY